MELDGVDFLDDPQQRAQHLPLSANHPDQRCVRPSSTVFGLENAGASPEVLNQR